MTTMGTTLNGILCVDKPAGFTSFDVVAKLRGILGTRKIGHSGTLDPMATGVLPVFVGNATKAIDLMEDHDKAYLAEITLGLTTDTLDITGHVIDRRESDAVTDERLVKALYSFEGEILQVPPMYSAVKVEGRKLYELAREGKSVKREARPVTIYQIQFLGREMKPHPAEILDGCQVLADTGRGMGPAEAPSCGWEMSNGSLLLDTCRVYVECSKGTYIRTLADDLGKELGCGAALSALRRVKACGFHEEDCLTLPEIEIIKKVGTLALLPVESVFSGFDRLALSPAQCRRFVNGAPLDAALLESCPEPGKKLCIYDESGGFVGLGVREEDNFRSLKLFKD